MTREADGFKAYDAIAGEYDRLRPGYPVGFIADALERAAVPVPGTVADLAAGTGKLTRVLHGLGLTVVAVEPLANLRARIPRGSRLAAVGGVAERLPFRDQALDAVVVGQGWHWFAAAAAAAEARRVLRPGGLLMVVTNSFDASAPWAVRVEQLRRGRPVTDAGGPFDGADGWLPGGELVGRHVHTVDRESVVDLVLTTSSAAAASSDRRQAIAAGVLAIGREHGLLDEPEVGIPFVLRARWARRAA